MATIYLKKLFAVFVYPNQLPAEDKAFKDERIRYIYWTHTHFSRDISFTSAEDVFRLIV